MQIDSRTLLQIKKRCFRTSFFIWYRKGIEPIYMQVSGGHLLPPVQALGSDGSAACGGMSDLSEWQRSTDDEGFSKPRKMSGTATGGYQYFSSSSRGRKMQIDSRILS